MRLLNIQSFQLHEFLGDEIPAYAIASHRWTQDELTYRDLLRGEKSNSAGYAKVKAYCDFLDTYYDRLKLRWLWIDTCCIDKASSAELAEAINSMFRWYVEASICLAFLHDVPSDQTKMRSFEDSVWFTRGWTLQELLAPRLVVFLDTTWQIFGHKATHLGQSTLELSGHAGPRLNEKIARVTGIPEEILWDYRNGDRLTLETKLRWMDHRTTSRIEDRAYCLLGIFNVYMPLLYGEREEAMARLMKKATKKHRLPSETGREGHVGQRGTGWPLLQSPASYNRRGLLNSNAIAGQNQSLVFVAVMGTTSNAESAFLTHVGDDEDVIGFGSSPKDFPDFQNTHPSDVEVLEASATWLSTFHRFGGFLRGVIYLESATTEWSLSSKKKLDIFLRLCGLDAMANVVFATIGWEHVSETVGALLEGHLIESLEDRGFTMTAVNRPERCKKDRGSALRVLARVLDLTTNVTLEIQNELVDQGKGLPQTKAGIEVARELAMDVEEASSIREDLHEEMILASLERDQDLIDHVRHQDAETKRRIEWIEGERRRLQDGIGSVDSETAGAILRLINTQP